MVDEDKSRCYLIVYMEIYAILLFMYDFTFEFRFIVFNISHIAIKGKPMIDDDTASSFQYILYYY